MKNLFKHSLAGLSAGILGGGVFAALEFVFFRETISLERSNIIRVMLAYSLYFSLGLFAIGLMTGLFTLRQKREWGSLFTEYLGFALVNISIAVFFNKTYRYLFQNPLELRTQIILISFFLVVGILMLAVHVLSKKFSSRLGIITISIMVVLYIFCVGYGLAPLSAKENKSRLSINPNETLVNTNVLILMVDTLRADHLGCYGYHRNTTPAIDQFKNDGVLFTRCSAASSWTRPSVASIITGMYPATHNQYETNSVIPREAVMIPGSMGQYGNKTLFISTNTLVSRAFGYGLDVDLFLGPRSRPFVGMTMPNIIKKGSKYLKSALGINIKLTYFFDLSESLCRTSEEDHDDAGWVNSNFKKWALKKPKKPFFAYLHYMEPHRPYQPRSPFLKKFVDPEYNGPDYVAPPMEKGIVKIIAPLMRAKELPEKERLHLINKYDAEIADFDSCFDDLLDFLKDNHLYDNTLIVLTSDHGEEFYEHGAWEHGHSLFQEIIHVPLIVKLPDNKSAGAVLNGTCSHVDILPTILELVGINPWQHLQGISLAPPIKSSGNEWPGNPAISDFKSQKNYLSSYIDGQKKVIHIETPDKNIWYMFDLEKDPQEIKSIHDENNPDQDKMKIKMKERINHYKKNSFDEQTTTLSKHDLEKSGRWDTSNSKGKET